jgi:hypothetical protein
LQHASSPKSVSETGKPLSIEMQPPKEMLAALQRLAGAGRFDSQPR